MNASDNGTELTSNAIMAFAAERSIGWHYTASGKPLRNGFVEGFNGPMQGKPLNETMFRNMALARAVNCASARDYSDERPNSALGYRTLKAFVEGRFTATDSRAAPAESPANLSIAPNAPNGVLT